MFYRKTTSDAYADFVALRSSLESNGIEVVSGEAYENNLRIGTDAEVPDGLRIELELTVD